MGYVKKCVDYFLLITNIEMAQAVPTVFPMGPNLTNFSIGITANSKHAQGCHTLGVAASCYDVLAVADYQMTHAVRTVFRAVLNVTNFFLGVEERLPAGHVGVLSPLHHTAALLASGHSVVTVRVHFAGGAGGVLRIIARSRSNIRRQNGSVQKKEE